MKHIIARIIEIADELDSLGLHKESTQMDTIIKKVAQKYQEEIKFWRVTSNTHIAPEIRREKNISMFTKDIMKLHVPYGLEQMRKTNRNEMPQLGQHWVEIYEIPETVYMDPHNVVMLWPVNQEEFDDLMMQEESNQQQEEQQIQRMQEGEIFGREDNEGLSSTPW